MGCDYIMICEEDQFWNFTLCGCQKNDTKPICKGKCKADFKFNSETCSCEQINKPKCCSWEVEMCTKSLPPQCKCIINPAIRFARDPYSCEPGYEWSQADCGCQPVAPSISFEECQRMVKCSNGILWTPTTCGCKEETIQSTTSCKKVKNCKPNEEWNAELCTCKRKFVPDVKIPPKCNKKAKCTTGTVWDQSTCTCTKV